MKVNGNDLILLGLCFGIASTIILGKGYIFKDIDAIQDDSASYFGTNPYAVKNKVIQKWEGAMGFILLIPFLLLQLFGIYQNVLKPKNESILLGSPNNLIFLILLAICIIWSSNLIACTIAKQKYIPILRDLLQEAISQTDFVLKNDGLYDKEKNQNQEINREIRDKRLVDMKNRLRNWERLFNFKRFPNEADIDYLLRLKQYLSNY